MRRRSHRIKKKDISILVLIGIVVAELIIISILFKKPPVPVKKKAEAPPPVAARGKIAIVLDDWGYNLKNTSYLRNIKYPLTLAILPNLAYSKRIAQDAKVRNNIETILHLPMEPYPHEDMGLEVATIKADMPKNTINKLLNECIKSVPYVKGVSNHMGSKATEDKRLIRYIFEELKKHRFYFLDSRVTDKSVCKEVAREVGLRFTQRSVFLDNKQDAAYIKQQLKELVKIAERNGKAVGIGHDKKTTLEVLEEEMPKIEKQGFEFVLLSELIN